MKRYTLEQTKDDLIGKVGTLERDQYELELEMPEKTECKPNCPIQAGHCYCQDPQVTPEDRKKLARQVKKHRG